MTREASDRKPWSLRFAVAVVAVGLLAGAFAAGFRAIFAGLLRLASGQADLVVALEHAPVAARLLLPALGGLVAGLLTALARRSRAGQGVGDVMEAIVLGGVRLSLKVTLLKSAASLAAMVTGGSIGREGPLVQLGAASGHAVARVARGTHEEARLLMAAGTAAGFAAAYNTPLAAVLFVAEVMTGVFSLDVIAPALVATAVASELTRVVVGAGPLYGVRSFDLRAPSELLAFAGLGLVAAFAAQAFMRALSSGESLFARWNAPAPLRAAVGGLGAGVFVAALPSVAGNGYEPLAALLDGRLGLGFVALLVLCKIAATTSSVSSGSPGGVFTPTLLVGGGVGVLYAGALTALGVAHGSAGGYALVGMAAATAATTHAPLMAAVLAFELSGDYAIVLPLVVATSLSAVLSRSLRRDSVYAAELRARGVALEVTLEGRRVERLRGPSGDQVDEG